MINTYKVNITKKIKMTLFSLIMVTIFLISFISFYKSIYRITIDKNMIRIEEQSDNIINLFKNEINDYIDILSYSEKFITSKSKIQSKEVIGILSNIEESSGFSEIGILDIYGKVITSEEKEFKQGDYFKNLEKEKNKYKYKEENYISDVFIDQDGKEKIMILIPINIDNKYEYCLYGKVEIDTFMNNFITTTNSEKYFQIIDNKGIYVYNPKNKNAFSKGENIWEELRKYRFDNKKDNVKNIKQNITEGKNGKFYFEYENAGRYVSYKPIGLNNWYIFSIQTEKEINAYIREVWNEITQLLFTIIITFILVTIVIIYYIGNSNKMIMKKNEQISIQNSIFRLILNKTNNIPFEIDLSNQEIILYLKDEKNPKKIKLSKLSPDNLIKNNIIRDEDYENYETVYSSIINVKEIKSEIIHIKIVDRLSWIKVNTVIIDKSNGRKHIVGILEDYNNQMDKEKKIKEHIRKISIMDKKSKTDFLTSILNRKGFIQEMNYYLSLENVSTSKDVFLILDLDNFKAVNDLLGHNTGDEVLIETADIIKRNLSRKDIVGRLAGDEFVALIKNIEERKDIESIAERLNRLLCRDVEKNGVKVPTSASIGMAIVEKEDRKFEDLYEKADKALYEVKNCGKNSYRIYDKYEKGLM